MSQNREGREFWDGVGGWGCEIELGGIEWRKEGGKTCLIQKREERVHLVLLFFVEHLALTLPYFLLLPPTRFPKRIHSQARGGPAESHASEPFLPSPLSRRLANIYLPCMVCLCPNCCNRQTLREERGKWGERVTGRQRGRNREGESESNSRGEGGGELYMLVTCI